MEFRVWLIADHLATNPQPQDKRPTIGARYVSLTDLGGGCRDRYSIAETRHDCDPDLSGERIELVSTADLTLGTSTLNGQPVAPPPLRIRGI